jgi:hypothetical protein
MILSGFSVFDFGNFNCRQAGIIIDVHHPQDMKAGREAGVVPIGVATGVFTAQQLSSAGAQKVIPDLKGADDILQILLKTNL